MTTVYVMTCIETDHQYLFLCPNEEVLKSMKVQLEQGKHFSSSLQAEWNQYGSDGFESGAVAQWDGADETEEELEEWKETLSELEVWETKDGKTGVER